MTSSACFSEEVLESDLSELPLKTCYAIIKDRSCQGSETNISLVLDDTGLGGKVKSQAKTLAARNNAKKGGRAQGKLRS